MQIFIYRPDLRPNKNVEPELVFTLDGKPFFEWKQDEDRIKDYKWRKAFERLENRPDWKLEVWR